MGKDYIAALTEREGSGRTHSALGWSNVTATKLVQQYTLLGHRGCVNRLAWSEDGLLLLSGSDDRKLNLWCLHGTATESTLVVPTLHDGNIFGVQFLPQRNSKVLVSCSMDRSVQLHRLDAPPLARLPHHNRPLGQGARPVHFASPGLRPSVQVLEPHHSSEEEDHDQNEAVVQTTVYNCHSGRVKGVEVVPGDSNLFLSVSEDGTVRQFDTRLPTDSLRHYDSHNVLLDVRSKAGRSIELKALAVNPLLPEQIAVAAGDEHVRLFDRRKLCLHGPHGAAALHRMQVPLLQVAPPHLTLSGSAGRVLHSTHVTFGNRGDKVMATYHGDQAYAWDTTAGAGPAMSALTLDPSAAAESLLAHTPAQIPCLSAFPGRCGARSAIDGLLSVGADRIRARGNLAFFEEQYSEAVLQYTAALSLAPDSAALHCHRAAALLQRKWRGDAAAALGDCEAALALDSHSQQALLHRLQALRACSLLRAAQAAARVHHARFPEDGAEVSALEQALEGDLEERAKQAAASRQRAEQRRNVRRRRGFSRQRRRIFRSARQAEGPSSGSGEPAEQEGPPAAVLAHATGAAASRAGDAHTAAGAAPSPDAQGAHAADTPSDSGSSEEDSDGEAAAVSRRPLHVLDEAYAEAITRAERTRRALNGDQGSSAGASCSAHPSLWAALPGGCRLLQRFVGQCNLQTDIKECAFLGSDDALAACCSDDGHVFIFNSASGACVKVLHADMDVVNCVKPHPSLLQLATSGIESAVRVWSPQGTPDAGNVDLLTARNQERMRADPGGDGTLHARLVAALNEDGELMQRLAQQIGFVMSQEEEGAGGEQEGVVSCRMS